MNEKDGDMQAQNEVSTPQVETIHRLAAELASLRPVGRRMVRLGKLYCALTVGTLLAAKAVEAFLGQPIEYLPVLLGEQVLIIPFVVVGISWNIKQGRICENFRELRRVLTPRNHAAPPAVPPTEIGPLLDVTMLVAANFPTGWYNEIAPVANLLGQLLQSIRAEDEITFTEDQRKRLHEIIFPRGLDYWKGGAGGMNGRATGSFLELCNQLRPAAIDALGVLGDSSSIQVLERFAAKTRDTALRTSALHSLETIRERVRYGPEQLLRAGASPHNPETLLRTVSTSPLHAGDSQQLLRADNADAERNGTNATQQTVGQTAPAPTVVLGRIETP